MPLNPENLAKANTESAHQIALFCWASQNLKAFPELRWLHHIPNGGSRGDSDFSRAIVGGRLKAEGVKKGVADVFLPVRRGAWGGLYIEMKRPAERPKKQDSRGGLSDEQIEFAAFVRQQALGWCVCYTWCEARDVIMQYLQQNG